MTERHPIFLGEGIDVNSFFNSFLQSFVPNYFY